MSEEATARKVSPTDLVMEILSQVPPKVELIELSDEFVRILKEQPEGSLLKQYFGIGRYGHSPQFEEVVTNLWMLGGLVVTSTYGSHRQRVTSGLHDAVRWEKRRTAERFPQFSENERAYLAQIAAQLKTEPSREYRSKN